MKIDQSKLKKKPPELSTDSHVLIEKFKNCDQNELNELLKSLTVWPTGNCSLYHWIDVLNRFDSILEEACLKTGKWILNCDRPENVQLKLLVIHILRFTALLIEHAYSRHLYNSIEHLKILLQSSHPDILLGVVSLIYIFARRSNHLTKTSSEIKEKFFHRLVSLADKWTGVNLIQCCTLRNPSDFPENLHRSDRNVGDIMEETVTKDELSEYDQIKLFYQLSIASSFSSFEQRLLWIEVRLQSLSILIYSTTISQAKFLLYDNLIEELVQVLHCSDPTLINVKASVFKTLIAMIHLEGKEKIEEVSSPLQQIIELTQVNTLDGFVPRLVRQTVDKLIDGTRKDDLSTALFSFLYHLVSYGKGSDALNNTQIIKPLIKLIDHRDQSKDFIKFVCRAIRIIGLLTRRDPKLIQKNDCLQSIIYRFQEHIKQCQNEQNEISSLGCCHQSIALLKSVITFLTRISKEISMDANTRYMIQDSITNSLKDVIDNVDYYGSALSQLATDFLTSFTHQ